MGIFKKPAKPRSVEPSSLADAGEPRSVEPSVPTDVEPSSPADAEPSVPDEAPVKTVTHLKENSETPLVPHNVVTLDPLETPVPVSPGVREQEKMLLGDLA